MSRIAYDQKLDALLAAAARVFAERGFHQTSMRDLSRLTGVSLAGWYYYVTSKDELLCVIQERTYSALGETVARALEDAATPVDRLERFVRAHLAFAAVRAAEMRVLVREEGALVGELAGRVRAVRELHAGTLDAVLAGLERVAGGAQVTRDLAARALVGMINALGEGVPAYDLEPLASDVCRLFLGGYLGAATAPAAVMSPRLSAHVVSMPA